jgi:hypothetical protein
MTDQHQQHGVGGVDMEAFKREHRPDVTERGTVTGACQAYYEDVCDCDGTVKTYPCDSVQLVAEVERLRARCASLEAVVKIYAEPFNWFQTIHMQSGDIPVNVWAWDDARVPWSMAAAALDQPATTTQEGTHG